MTQSYLGHCMRHCLVLLVPLRIFRNFGNAFRMAYILKVNIYIDRYIYIYVMPGLGVTRAVYPLGMITMTLVGPEFKLR